MYQWNNKGKIMHTKSPRTLFCVLAVTGLALAGCGYIETPERFRSYQDVGGSETARVRLYSFLTTTVIYPDAQCANRGDPRSGAIEKSIMRDNSRNLGIEVPAALLPPGVDAEYFEDFTLPAGRPVTISIQYTATPNYAYANVAYSCNEAVFTFVPKKGADYQLWYVPTDGGCPIGLQELSREPAGNIVAKPVADARRSRRCDA